VQSVVELRSTQPTTTTVDYCNSLTPRSTQKRVTEVDLSRTELQASCLSCRLRANTHAHTHAHTQHVLYDLRPRLTSLTDSNLRHRSTTNKSSAVAEMGDRGHNRHGPKRGGLLCPFRGGAGSPSNTVWPGPRSTSVPIGVFIHPALSPQ